MKKKIASISIAAALIVSSLSTAGMSVFASEADVSTTSAVTVISAEEETTTAATTSTTAATTATTSTTAAQSVPATQLKPAKPDCKDILGQFVSKLFSTTTTTAAQTTTTTAAETTTTTAAETTTTTAAETTTTTAADTTTTSADAGETTAAAQTTTTTAAQSVPVTPVQPAKPNYQAIAKKIITKIFSKKYSQVTVSNKNVVLLKNHYSLIKASGKGYISYFSLNKNVATVDKYGIIKGVKAGNTRVRVIDWGNSEYYPSTTYVNVSVKSSLSDLFATLYK